MADALPWVMIAVAAGLVIVGLLALTAVRKRKGKAEETDYRAFFLMGISWLFLGVPFIFIYGETFNALFALGVIFTVMGAANRKNWKKEPLSKNQKLAWIGVFVAMIVLAAFTAYVRSMAA